jgi:hypothetical protein
VSRSGVVCCPGGGDRSRSAPAAHDAVTAHAAKTMASRFGALIVNLTDAVLPGREVTLEIDAFCGKLIVIVPGRGT